MSNLKKLVLFTAVLSVSNLALANSLDPYQGWFFGGG